MLKSKLKNCLILSISAVLLFGCDKNSNDQKTLINEVLVIEEGGAPLPDLPITLVSPLTGLKRLAEGVTDQNGIVTLEYPDYSYDLFYNHMYFGIDGRAQDGFPQGYVGFLGPNIDHTIVVYEHEELIIEMLTEDYDTQVYSLLDTITLEMKFKSNISTPFIFDIGLNSQTGRIKLKHPDGSFVFIPSGELHAYIDINGEFTFQFIPNKLDASVRFNYVLKDQSQHFIIYEFNVQ